MATYLTPSQRSHIVETEPFHETFGPKAQRKKPRIDVGTFEELSKLSLEAGEVAEQGLGGRNVAPDRELHTPSHHETVVDMIWLQSPSHLPPLPISLRTLISLSLYTRRAHPGVYTVSSTRS